MREIKFKGKRVDNGEWAFGGIDIIKCDGIVIEVWIRENFTDNKVDPETVCEFTGLHDINGVDLYEGDIVYIAGYGDYECEFPFIELYEGAIELDIGEKLGNIHDKEQK